MTAYAQPSPSLSRSQPLPDLLSGVPAAALAQALATAGLVVDWTPDQFAPLAGHGLMHAHIQLGHIRLGTMAGVSALARLPSASLPGLTAAASLVRQAEAFRLLGPSGHVPALLGMLTPTEALPCGGLVVEEIEGRAPRLPDDLPALARALAAIHSTHGHGSKGSDGGLGSLADDGDHLAASLARIDRHLEQLPAETAPETRAALATARAEAGAYVVSAAAAALPLATILVDAHPGNFRIRPDGTAVAVDLEKVALGPPGIDIAHLVLPSSVDWDPDCPSPARPADAHGFAQIHAEALSTAGWRTEALALTRASLMPLRQLVWLRTTAFCAAFLASPAARQATPLARHFCSRAARALSPDFIAALRRDWLGGAGDDAGRE